MSPVSWAVKSAKEQRPVDCVQVDKRQRSRGTSTTRGGEQVVNTFVLIIVYYYLHTRTCFNIYNCCSVFCECAQCERDIDSINDVVVCMQCADKQQLCANCALMSDQHKQHRNQIVSWAQFVAQRFIQIKDTKVLHS